VKSKIYKLVILSAGIFGVVNSKAQNVSQIQASECTIQIEKSCGVNIADEIRYTPVYLINGVLDCSISKSDDDVKTYTYSDSNEKKLFIVTVDSKYMCYLTNNAVQK
jgi:hypothetical protein